MSRNPAAKFNQHFLALATLTDAGGVVDTIDDESDGSVEILTTANSGTLYLTIPIDIGWQGDKVDPARLMRYVGFIRLISGLSDNDRISIGLSDNVDPSAGLFEIGGLRQVTATTFAAHEGDEVGEGTGGTATVTDPRSIYATYIHMGLTRTNPSGITFDGGTWKARRPNTSIARRAFVPTHIVIRVQRNTAAITTLKFEAGSILFGGPKSASIDGGALSFQRIKLNDGSWTATDTSGVVDEIDDDGAHTSVLTTATVGTVYYTKPLTDFLGGDVDPGIGVLVFTQYAEKVAAFTSSTDNVGGVVSDNANPLSGKRLFGNVRESGDVVAGNDLSSGTSGGVGADRIIIEYLFAAGRSDYSATAYGFTDADTYSGARNQIDDRAFTPTHFGVTFRQAGASVQTMEFIVGTYVQPAIDLAIAPRVS